ncbi:MAG: hypothetical protein HND48_05610 [Chloroflexi bacterium]|nr:hypothetical protein [Chloroflexota bacterium]
MANGGRAPDVVHPGVDPAALDTTPEHVAALRARLGLDGCRVILVAGRLTPLKGSVQAAARRAAHLPRPARCAFADLDASLAGAAGVD